MVWNLDIYGCKEIWKMAQLNMLKMIDLDKAYPIIWRKQELSIH